MILIIFMNSQCKHYKYVNAFIRAYTVYMLLMVKLKIPQLNFMQNVSLSTKGSLKKDPWFRALPPSNGERAEMHFSFKIIREICNNSPLFSPAKLSMLYFFFSYFAYNFLPVLLLAIISMTAYHLLWHEQACLLSWIVFLFCHASFLFLWHWVYESVKRVRD